MAHTRYGRGSDRVGSDRAGSTLHGQPHDSGLTFRAVGLPALAGALAASKRLPADQEPLAGRPARIGHHDDSDDSVALRSGN